MLIRHDTSAYNVLKDKKRDHPLYKKFLGEFALDPESKKTKKLADKVWKKFALGNGDAETELADVDGRQAYETGLILAAEATPDVVFVSPYKRAPLTLHHLTRGWHALKGVEIVEEERVREQEHGLALLYSDWRVFHTLHSDQKQLHAMEGPYWYRYPQGENVPDVRKRNRDWIDALIRDFSKKRVLVVTHHLNILAMRANLERWDANKFIEQDREEKPINCGVTHYVGNPEGGRSGKGKLVLGYYNKRHYK